MLLNSLLENSIRHKKTLGTTLGLARKRKRRRLCTNIRFTMKRMIHRVVLQKDGPKVKKMIEVLTHTKIYSSSSRIRITWRRMLQRDLRKYNIRRGLVFKLRRRGLRSKSRIQRYRQPRDK